MGGLQEYYEFKKEMEKKLLIEHNKWMAIEDKIEGYNYSTLTPVLNKIAKEDRNFSFAHVKSESNDENITHNFRIELSEDDYPLEEVLHLTVITKIHVQSDNLELALFNENSDKKYEMETDITYDKDEFEGLINKLFMRLLEITYE